MTSAKALGGGMPIGACVTTPEAGEVLEPGDHGSTFAAGPVASAAALAVLEIVDDPALLRSVRELGAQLREGLLAHDGVREVRGRGLMAGVGLERWHRRRRTRRRPARAWPDRQRARARNAAPAAAADGRIGPGRAGRWRDRRRAPKLRGPMSSDKRPREPRALTSSTAERLAAIVEAAEQAASKVIDDAEEQARRQLQEAGARADRIVAERLRALADELDPQTQAAPRREPHLRPVETESEPAPAAGRRSSCRRRSPARDPDGRIRQQSRRDRTATAQWLRDRGHERDPRRDTRTGGVNPCTRTRPG